LEKSKYMSPWVDNTDKNKRIFVKLTDDDIRFSNGKEDEMLGGYKAKLEVQKKSYAD